MKFKHAIIISLILFSRPLAAPEKDKGLIYDEILAHQEKVSIENLKAKIDTSDFTPELFLQALYIYVESPEVVYRQAVLESGWFSSELFKRHNNPFGMRYAIHRPKTALYRARIGKVKNYAGYAHWSDAVRDLALWQEYWKSQGHDLEDYYGFLRDLPYATARNYIPAVKSIDLPSV